MRECERKCRVSRCVVAFCDVLSCLVSCCAVLCFAMGNCGMPCAPAVTRVGQPAFPRPLKQGMAPAAAPNLPSPGAHAPRRRLDHPLLPAGIICFPPCRPHPLASRAVASKAQPPAKVKATSLPRSTVTRSTGRETAVRRCRRGRLRDHHLRKVLLPPRFWLARAPLSLSPRGGGVGRGAAGGAEGGG